MAIEINEPTKPFGVNPPTITLTGQLQDVDSGRVIIGETTVSVDENNITQNGLSVKRRSPSMHMAIVGW